MRRQIRLLGIGLLVCFLALFVQLNYVQVAEAHKLATAPGNTRATTQSYASPRGSMQTADGVVIADSVPSSDNLKFQRQYPQGLLYGQVTGYYSFIYGSDGLERTYNEQLQGKQLPIKNLRDLFSSRLQVGNLTLTLSDKVQKAAQAALGSRQGAVVVLDPRTGGVTAMWSNPSYDPTPLASHDVTAERNAWNLLNLDPSKPLLPTAYRETFPPGSTFKMVTSSAVFDHNPALATKFYPVVSQIPLPLTTNTLHNYNFESCGGQLPELLKVSCDTGFGQIGLDLGPDPLSAEAQAFGFDKAPPIDLPSPAVSKFPAASYFAGRTPLLAYGAIGQDVVTASTLQMALVGSAIADGGTIMTPHLMASIRNAQGSVVDTYNPKAWLRATSAATAGQVKAAMELVTQPGGTAPDLVIPGVPVAAKTGTAQTGRNSTDDWMVAMAPADNPTVVVAVTVPGQPPSASGDSTDGPITLAVLEAALAAMGSPPAAAPATAPAPTAPVPSNPPSSAPPSTTAATTPPTTAAPAPSSTATTKAP